VRTPLSARIGIYLILVGLVFDLFLRYARGVEYLVPGIGVFSTILSPLGLILLVGTAVFQLIALRRERAQRISLISPQPQSDELQIGRGLSPSRNEQRIEIGSPLRRSVWVGIGLLLMGIALFACIQYWMATRTFTAVDMPISLAPGQTRTGSFLINLEGEYQIRLDAGDFNLIAAKCASLTPFKVRWGLHDRKYVFSTERQGFLPSNKGTYDLDLQVLSDSSCLNSGHPRLRIYTSKSDHAETTPALWLSALAMVVGASMLVRFALARHRCRLSSATDITDSESVSQHFQWAQMLALKPAFTTLPSFGLICTLVLSWLVMLHMVFYQFGRFRSQGLAVFVMKSVPHPDQIDRWDVPLVLKVEAAGPNLPPTLYLNSKPLSWDDLNSSLRAALSMQPVKVVYVEAGTDVSWQDVLRAIDASRSLQARVVLLTSATESRRR
jgi:biopolymer transport protein ExbD